MSKDITFLADSGGVTDSILPAAAWYLLIFVLGFCA
jgi:hypothetical protein